MLDAPARPSRLAIHWLAILGLGAGCYLATRPAFALAHEGLVVLAAGLLSGLATQILSSGLLRALPLDPVYTGAALWLLGDVQTAGVAVAEPLGRTLHGWWPTAFSDPSLVSDGAWASAIILPGSTVVARGIGFLAADVGMLVTGLALWHLGALGPASGWRVACAVCGGALQVHVLVDHLLIGGPSVRDLESLGIPFAVSVLFRGTPEERPRLTALLLALPEPAQALLVGGALAAAAYVLSVALVHAAQSVWRHVRRATAALAGQQAQPRSRPRLSNYAARTTACALLLGLSPIGEVIDADSRILAPEIVPAVEVEPAPEILPSAGPPLPIRAAGPVNVSISGAHFQYRYEVSGRPQLIRGMGYNVRYAELPAAERAERYDRDFGAMRAAGVNTIFGWDPDEFDRLTLDRAASHGLGVAPPYELRPDLDYTDPDVRAAVAEDIQRWVMEYRDHPAVRVWAVGNEVLHKLVYPSWMPGRAEPWREERAAAFGGFLVELADRIHALDPNHPVIHRDAEDAYTRHVREALARDGMARPWFVYGVNVYTPRLAEIIDDWGDNGFDGPLFISEFAPAGLGPDERSAGLQEMWRTICAARGRLVGGAVYTWTTDGPEEVDRIFGLVDEGGRPVDGALETVGRMFREDPAPASK